MRKEQNQKKTEKEIRDVSSLEKEIQRLALVIDKVEDEKLEIQNQLKKALADYHNLLKSSEKREELRVFQMKKNICEQIIPSLDAMLLAVNSSSSIKLDEEGKSWLDGILATLESINKGMKELGLEQYVPEKGDKFDSNKHEAVAVVEQGEKGSIFDIIQPGYLLNGSVIRPARVVVSK